MEDSQKNTPSGENRRKHTDGLEELEARLREPATVREAFGELVRRFSEPLYWQIRRLVGNHHDADDVLQNTFLKAWSNIENFRGEARVSTWLHKIAINESLTHLDSARRRATDSLDESMPVGADQEIDGDELTRKLHKAIGGLAPKQRLVFNMRYFDEMKYEDISNILGTSVGALKASYHAAVKKIEHFFKEL